MSCVIILNGVGSVGKSTIAKALQAIASAPFLHVEMDAFLEMMPEALQNHLSGFAFESIEEDRKPAIVIHTGPIGAQLIRGMHHAIAAMADQGNNLIVDDVMTVEGGAAYRDLLSRHTLHLVGLFAPLEVLEARERERGNRGIGLARWQFYRVHRGMEYDLAIDTSLNSPTACAALIKQQFGL
jgi:chloramphenicol 3-O phosphotransferase